MRSRPRGLRSSMALAEAAPGTLVRSPTLRLPKLQASVQVAIRVVHRMQGWPDVSPKVEETIAQEPAGEPTRKTLARMRYEPASKKVARTVLSFTPPIRLTRLLSYHRKLNDHPSRRDLS